MVFSSHLKSLIHYHVTHQRFHVDSWGVVKKRLPAMAVGCGAMSSFMWCRKHICYAVLEARGGENASFVSNLCHTEELLETLTLWTKAEPSRCFYLLLCGIDDTQITEDDHTEIKAMVYLVCADATVQLLCDVWRGIYLPPQSVQTLSLLLCTGMHRFLRYPEMN